MSIPTMGNAAPTSRGGFSASTPARSSTAPGADFAGLVAVMLAQSQEPASDTAAGAGAGTGAGSGEEAETGEPAAPATSPATADVPAGGAEGLGSAGAEETPAPGKAVPGPHDTPGGSGADTLPLAACPGATTTIPLEPVRLGTAPVAAHAAAAAQPVAKPAATAGAARGEQAAPGQIVTAGALPAGAQGRAAAAAVGAGAGTTTASAAGSGGEFALPAESASSAPANAAGPSRGEPGGTAMAVQAAGQTAGDAGSLQGTATGNPATGANNVTAPTPVSATHTSGAGAGPVGGQVFPEVARLVTRGDGTQRLTLRLSPEELGNVRIVVTVRDGAVDVSLAAGADAQEALRHGSPDLRRLLESIGATSTQIAVRDLPSGQASTGQPSGHGGASTHTDTTTGHGREQAPGETSRHRGTRQGAEPAGSPRPPTDDPTAHASASGVDLRL